MRQRIFIVGGDGFARECASYLMELEQYSDEVEFGGFLGHNGYRVDFKSAKDFFLGDLSDYNFVEGEFAVIGVGFPELRVKIY